MHLLEEVGIQFDAFLRAGHDQLVEQTLCHHGRRRSVLIERELVALWVLVAAMVGEDGIRNSGKVRAFREVAVLGVGPYEHVIRKVTNV